jgi:23S rRNA (cytosine1962-C5)-methyltransferase
MRNTINALVPNPSEPIARVYMPRPSRHPNIFRKRIERAEGNPQPGDWVAVYATDMDPNENQQKHEPILFGYGIYNPRSEVAVRLYFWQTQLPTLADWDALLSQAVHLRHHTLQIPKTTNAYRVLHGESDGFPGLVVDRYGDCLSAEVFSLGMAQRATEILERLHPLLGTKHGLVRPSPQFTSQEGGIWQDSKSENFPAYVTVEENQVKYRIHFGTGHKTGFFCDQRENRAILASHAAGKSVLDVCCYSGGFSVAAAKSGQASEVVGVDLDEEALVMAKKNADINDVRVRYVHADAFAYMRDMARNNKQFDIVVLDPPKLIRSRTELEEGTRKHIDLNRLAIQLVKPGGILLTCCCAGLLDGPSFMQVVQSAARATGTNPDGTRARGRVVQIFETRSAAMDHPVATHCPETGYLKAHWCRIL